MKKTEATVRVLRVQETEHSLEVTVTSTDEERDDKDLLQSCHASFIFSNKYKPRPKIGETLKLTIA